MEQYIKEIEDGWLPPFWTEYDGKYMTLWGKHKDSYWPPGGYYGPDGFYDDMVLSGCLFEQRNIDHQSIEIKWDDKNIYVTYNLTDGTDV